MVDAAALGQIAGPFRIFTLAWGTRAAVRERVDGFFADPALRREEVKRRRRGERIVDVTTDSERRSNEPAGRGRSRGSGWPRELTSG